jgi:hypothetical protein
MSNNFWAKKLGAPTPTQSAPTVYNQPQSVPAPVGQQPQQGGDTSGHDFSKANHLQKSGECPECRSGNFMQVGTQANRSGTFAVMRCFSCGYPKTQSGSGVGISGGSNSGPAKPARQVSTANNFNPGTIIGTIDNV